jgi:menaquinone-dependent protoporphyrinogen IX oxidase
MKFSGSEGMNGNWRIRLVRRRIRRKILIVSFLEKNGWKLILSLSLGVDVELEEPFLWREKMWIKIIINIMNGKMK